MQTALRNLHLVKDDKMTHAGAWLLCDDITRFTLRAGVTCALFRGTTNVHILDRRDFTGDLYSIYEECMGYLQSRLNTAMIPHAHGREERLELPSEALREAMVNAIAHRDYRSTANVQVHIYHDRVEVITPGGLPAGMKEEDLGQKSLPRNPLLFGLFYRMDLVEQIGSGVLRIRDLCRDYGVPEPVFDVSENWVTVAFPRLTPQLPPQVGTKSALSRHQVEILRKCRNDSALVDLMAVTERTDRTKFRDKVLNPMLEAGLIEMTIPDKPRSKNQRYRLTAKGRAIQAARRR
jgi:ATP-dependent DNA helicase RecG